MAIFVIFWCAVLGITFWTISIILKAIESAIYSIYDAIIECGVITLLGIAGLILMYVLYKVSFGIRTGTFWSMVGSLILGCIALAILLGLWGWIGALILEIAALVVTYIIGFCVKVLEFLNVHAEGAYVFFLKKIKQRVELL